MKKLLLIFISISLIFCFSSCEKKIEKKKNKNIKVNEEKVNEKNKFDYKLSVITNGSDIDDGSVNQSIYKSCKDFCKKNNIKLNYYIPESEEKNSKIKVIDKAVNNGSSYIILNGDTFSNILNNVSKKYKNVKFIGVDILEEDIDFELNDNVYCLSFKKEISGFLAGVAAVELGYKDFGFIGAKENSSTKKYGYGFIQGIDYAGVKEKKNNLNIKYFYANQSNNDSKITSFIDKWYKEGVELIFTTGGNIYKSVAESASKFNGKIIGSDVDQINLIDQYGSGITVTSAVNNYEIVIKNILENIIKNNKWEEMSGITEEFGLNNIKKIDDCYIKLPINTTQWNSNFSKDDYEKLLKNIYDGNVKIIGDISRKPRLNNANVIYIK